MKIDKHVKTYILLGKILCGCAGGIIGFVTLGPVMIVPGIALGILSGYLMKKGILSTSF